MSGAIGALHHIDITVTDLAQSTEFYDRVLPLLGWQRRRDAAEGAIWSGERTELGLQLARVGSSQVHDRYAPGLHHLAFAAPSRDAVDSVYGQLQRLGVSILDAPAQYDRYEPGYYAVFFSGPDGVKLEYVFTPPPV